MMRGKFITFEGGEGAGKSTQVAMLAERLRHVGIETVITREPGGTPLSEAIRSVVLDAEPELVTELLLFAAARAEHVAKVIHPALEHGSWVVCDRFMDSTRVYQGFIGGAPKELIDELERRTVAPDYPDLTIVLDLPAEQGLKRTQARGTLSRFDAEGLEYHRRLKDGFVAIAESEPQRCLVLDADRSADEIASDVWSAVQSRLLGSRER